MKNITTTELRQLIRESVKDRLAQMREAADNHKKEQAQAIVDILEDEAQTLDALAKTAMEMYEEKQFEELKREAESLEKLRDAKMSKAKAIASKYGLEVQEEEKKKKPSASMTKKEKSNTVKQARAGKDLGNKGKGFEKVAKAAGGGEKGKKIATAQMWKQQAKK